MKAYDVFVPYCCLVQVRVVADELEEDAQAFEAALQTLDNAEPTLQFVDGQGAAVDDNLLDIVEGRYTKSLVYVDGFQNRVQKVGWSTSRPRASKHDRVERPIVAIQFDAGKLRRCFIIYSESGKVLEAIDESCYEFNTLRRRYPNLTFLGTYKTTVAEYRRLLKEFSRKP